MITATEIINDIKANRSPKTIQDWLNIQSQPDTSSEELARVRQSAQLQTTAVAGLFQETDRGKTSAQLLARSLNDPEFGYGRDVIPAYLSIIAILSAPRKETDPALVQALNGYERAMFYYLPEQARIDILNKRLISILNGVNVVAELQVVYAVEQFWDDGSWSVPYKQALMQNTEILGDAKLVLNNAPVSSTVAHWIQDFNTGVSSEFANTPGAYDQVRYINSSPSVAQLKPKDKGTLSQILHLYSWLADPAVNEEELAAYESSRATQQEQKLGLPKFEPIKQIILSHESSRGEQQKSFPRSEVAGIEKRMPTINMQDILNRRGQGGGVVYDNETNVKVEEIGQRLEAERQQKQSDIDKKLEALKKRRG